MDGANIIGLLTLSFEEFCHQMAIHSQQRQDPPHYHTILTLHPQTCEIISFFARPLYQVSQTYSI